jgi:hypothetical protein
MKGLKKMYQGMKGKILGAVDSAIGMAARHVVEERIRSNGLGERIDSAIEEYLKNSYAKTKGIEREVLLENPRANISPESHPYLEKILIS